MRFLAIFFIAFWLQACCHCQSVRFPAGTVGEREVYLPFDAKAWQKLDLSLQSAWGKAMYAKQQKPLKILLRLKPKANTELLSEMENTHFKRATVAGRIVAGEIQAAHLESLAKLSFVDSVSLQEALSTKSN